MNWRRRRLERRRRRRRSMSDSVDRAVSCVSLCVEYRCRVTRRVRVDGVFKGLRLDALHSHVPCGLHKHGGRGARPKGQVRRHIFIQ